MSKPVLCRLVSIKFRDLKGMMIRGRIYADVNGSPVKREYSYTFARHLHRCITNGSERKVYIRTDGIY